MSALSKSYKNMHKMSGNTSPALIILLILFCAFFSQSNAIIVTVDTSAKYQTIDGFGGNGPMNVWWSGGPFFNSTYLVTLIDSLGVTLLRNEYYSEEAGQDASWAKQSPWVKAVNDYAKSKNEPLGFILSALSPPSRMKDNSSLQNGGSLKPDSVNAYGDWWVQAINNYKAQGVTVYGVSMQSEPRFTQPYNSCVMLPTQYKDVLKVVAPKIKAASPTTLMFGPEDMFATVPDFQEYTDAIRLDPIAKPLLNAVAFHGNTLSGSPLPIGAGNRIRLSYLWTLGQSNGYRSWQTETSGYTNDWAGTFQLASEMMAGLRYGKLSAWVYWYLSGDLMTTAGNALTQKGYAAKQFYRYIRPGAVQVGSVSSDSANVVPVVFQDSLRSTMTIVLINCGTSDQTITFQGPNLPLTFTGRRTTASENCVTLGSVASTATLTLPASSISTFVGTLPPPKPGPLTYSANPAIYTQNAAIITNTCTNSGGAATSFTSVPILPNGLSINPTTGAITGTPLVTAPQATYSITATNAGGTSDPMILTLTVNPVKPGPLTYSANTASYTQNAPITTNTCTNSGGPATSFTSIPPLPNGLSINQTTGAITGTPSVTASQTTYSITATNAGGTSNPVTLTLTVTANIAKPGPLSYRRTPLASYINVAISTDTLTNSGGIATFTATPTLPSGLDLDAATGHISGTPSSVSSLTSYKIKATNAAGADSVTLPISVIGTPGPIRYTTDTAQYFAGVGITPNTVTNNGGAPDSFIITPTLPTGLDFSNTNGTISGQPAGAIGLTAYTVTARNPAGSATATIRIWVIGAPSITYQQSIMTYTVGKPVVPDSCVNNGGTADSLTVSPSLPAGLAIDKRTGVIRGTPTAITPQQIYRVTAINRAGSSGCDLRITVQSGAPGPITYSVNSAIYVRNTAISPNTCTNAGEPADSFTIDPALPAGLKLDKSTGAIGGTATIVSAAKPYTVTAYNTGGAAQALITVTVLELGAAINPYSVSGRRVDDTHAQLSISGFLSIRSASDPIQPWTDTIYIWYRTGSFPSVPTLADTSRFRFSLAAMQSGGDPYTATVTLPPLPPTSNGYYYFAVTSRWHNPDTILPFVRTSGDSVLMRDTTSPANPLTLSAEYPTRTADTAVIRIGRIDSLDVLKADTILLTCSFNQDMSAPFLSKGMLLDTLRLRAAAGQYAVTVRNTLFKGAPDTVYGSVIVTGRNGLRSQPVGTSFTIGHVTPANPIQRLAAQAINAGQIALNWNRIGGADSIRIVYGTSTVPLLSQVGTGYLFVNPRASDTIDTITGLDPQTLYHFGAQAFLSGEWTAITASSSTSATTTKADSTLTIVNSIVITRVWFDTASRQIKIAWKCPDPGTGYALEYGVDWRVSNSVSGGAVVPKKTTTVTRTPDTTMIDLGEMILFDTTYLITMHLRRTGGLWTLPTDSSSRSVRTPPFSTQPVSLFISDTSRVSVSNGNLTLMPVPGKPWTGGIVQDTLERFQTTAPALDFTVVSQGFAFRNGDILAPLRMIIRYNPIPAGVSTHNIRLYTQRNDGTWIRIDGTTLDTLAHTMTVDTILAGTPFVLMIDTAPPRASSLSTTHPAVIGGQSIFDTIVITDNIANSTATLLYGQGSNAPKTGATYNLTTATDSILLYVPADSVKGNSGMRILCVVNDGVNRDTLDVSRSLALPATKTARVPSPNKWHPVFADAVLDKSDLPHALTGLSAAGSWLYDKKDFRIVRWAQNGGVYQWLEYAGDRQNQFALEPGRIVWACATQVDSTALGSGITTPLTTAQTIRLAPKTWTDFGVPFTFDVRLSDVFDITPKGADSLLFCSWVDGTVYRADMFFTKKLPGFSDSNVVMTAGKGYCVYNYTSDTMDLRIPALPLGMSKHPPLLSKQTTNPDQGWFVTVQPHLEGGIELNKLYCGYTIGRGTADAWLPAAPGFGTAGIRVHNPADDGLYGHVISTGSDSGHVFELVFNNWSDTAKTITCDISTLGTLPNGVGIGLAGSDGTAAIDQELSVPVKPHENVSRFLTVGTSSFRNRALRGPDHGAFSCAGIFTTPGRGIVAIRYVVPSKGLKNVNIQISNILGRTVWSTTIGKTNNPGIQTAVWQGRTPNGGPVTTGMYLIKLTAQGTESGDRTVIYRRMSYIR